MSDSHSLSPPPSTLDRETFLQCYGGVYEHSPWIAEAAWEAGLDSHHDTAEGLATAMADALAAADRERKLALLRAHPELAGKAAVRRTLTAASTDEQAGAGLDQCTPDEYQRFQELNRAYNERFGFPFILAVKGYHRTEILDAFASRVANPPEEEFRTALEQVNRIALLRLQAMAGAAD